MKPSVVNSLDSFKSILEGKQPWIVAFTKTDECAACDELGEALDGFGRVAIVNTKKRADVLKYLVSG